MNKIPTAEDFCNERLGFEEYGTDVPYFMIKFTKLHVEAALKKAEVKGSEFMSGGASYEEYQQAVLNSYPLENIK